MGVLYEGEIHYRICLSLKSVCTGRITDWDWMRLKWVLWRKGRAYENLSLYVCKKGFGYKVRFYENLKVCEKKVKGQKE